MSELITMTELADTELDTVCGGFLNFNWGNTVTQSNSAQNISVPVLNFGPVGATTQTISQTNSSSITQTFTL
jgi:spore coat protein U-like protein